MTKRYVVCFAYNDLIYATALYYDKKLFQNLLIMQYNNSLLLTAKSSAVLLIFVDE